MQQVQTFPIEIATTNDVDDILAIQQANLSKNRLDTPRPLLKDIIRDNEVAVAREKLTEPSEQGRVIGYLIPLSWYHALQIPPFMHFLRALETVSLQGKPLMSHRYQIFGQLAIAREYRGLNLMRPLHDFLKGRLQPADYLVTEINAQNTRSLHACAKIGWRSVQTYQHRAQLWHIVILDPNI